MSEMDALAEAMTKEKQAEQEAAEAVIEAAELATLSKTPHLVKAVAELARELTPAQQKSRLRRAMRKDVVATMVSTSPFWRRHPGLAKQAANKALREAVKP